MIKFKILDTATGLYSHGGYTPHWDNRGKSWDTLGSVTSSLKLYLRGYSKNAHWYSSGKSIPETWAVVEFQVTLSEIKRTSVKDLLGEPVPMAAAKLKAVKPKCKRPQIKKVKDKKKKAKK